MKKVTPTFKFSRWIGRKLLPIEDALVMLFERQRRRDGRVRAFVNDPEGRLVKVIQNYVAWIQAVADRRDALVFTPKVEKAFQPATKAPKRIFRASARTFRKHQGKPLCIGQVVLFGADAYCPSVPMWRNYFDQIFSLGRGYLNLKGSILIVHGNIARRHGRRTAFARKFQEVQAGNFYQIIDAPALLKAATLHSAQAPVSLRRAILPRPKIVPFAPWPAILPSAARLPLPRGTPTAA